MWLVISVILYPITSLLFLVTPELAILFAWPRSLSRYGALASGMIVCLILWLYALPRDLAWDIGPIAWESRFVLPLSAYLCGLSVVAMLMSWTRRTTT
jgi:hypothetical protein